MDALTAKLYQQGDARRDSAFAYIYIIATIGSAIPAVNGTIALLFSYHAAFALSDSDRVEALHVDEQITPLEAGKRKGTATGR